MRDDSTTLGAVRTGRATGLTGWLLVALLVLIGCGEADTIETSVAVSEAMSGGDTTGYAKATEVRDFVFPDDHGPHRDFKLEWWYFTGNMDSEAGRRFGYQFTIFRVALTPSDSILQGRVSDWATNQFYMGHAALSDLDGEGFYEAERFSREAGGLAGARAVPFRVWLEDWEAASLGTSGSDQIFPMRVRASEEGTGFDLQLTPAKPYVLQGDRGLDPKGPGEGNASYYYSYTRLNTTGTVMVAGERFDVSGLSWMDREWSTSALGEGQVGWDWFALQLSNGDDLMYYQIREADGAAGIYSNGILVDPEGRKTAFEHDDVELTVIDTWRSPLSDAEYPAGWRLRVPEQDVDLRIEPLMADQELDVSVRYWEGAVRIEGTIRGEPVTGRGYVEMTGYGDEDAMPVS